MRKHGRNGSLATPSWSRVSVDKPILRKRINLSCEPGRRSYLWQLDPNAPKIIKH